MVVFVLFVSFLSSALALLGVFGEPLVGPILVFSGVASLSAVTALIVCPDLGR